MKLCPKCEVKKKNIEFRKDSKRYDGLDGWCKNCRSNWQKENLDKCRARTKRYLKHSKEKQRFSEMKYRFKNPIKIKAQQLAKYKFQVRQKCSVEGCSEIGERHHHDYNKPYEILWLCKKHHKQLFHPKA